jgi:glycosyltransferase involved in cell wall biosynthesis
MKEKTIKKVIGETMMGIAEGIESGSFGSKIKIGLTTIGSEHGQDNLIKGAELAQKKNKDLEVVLIGKNNHSNLETIEVENESDMHKKMEELLESGYISGCVTMHYNFPVGVSTVGRLTTPGKGKETFLATTTGTSSVDRSEAMVKNAIHGIIAAKASGIDNPTLGILNLDGARQVEIILKKLSSKGYNINFAESVRADKGSIMRGNDLLQATADVLVTDTLTGNILMKVFSAYTTGGSYESLGYGYGPGIGEKFDNLILILSRASGVPVVANSISYAKDLVLGKVKETRKTEFKKLKDIGFEDILKELNSSKEVTKKKDKSDLKPPKKEIVSEQIAGIDILDLENAVESLWSKGIYAESGMGCTGPVVLVNEANLDKSKKILIGEKFIIE